MEKIRHVLGDQGKKIAGIN